MLSSNGMTQMPGNSACRTSASYAIWTHRKIMKRLGNLTPPHPLPEECEALWELADTPHQTREHCKP